jgi:hypothetical protein
VPITASKDVLIGRSAVDEVDGSTARRLDE